MQELLIYLNAGFFFLMGAVALARPNSVPAYLGMHALTPDMRNEVRAVYGGFGLAVAGTLVAATALPGLREGIVLTIAVSVFGMAFGRLVSFAAERPTGPYPYVYFVVEIVLGGTLLFAHAGPTG